MKPPLGRLYAAPGTATAGVARIVRDSTSQELADLITALAGNLTEEAAFFWWTDERFTRELEACVYGHLEGVRLVR